MKERIDEEMVRYLWRLRPVIDDRRRPASRSAPGRAAAPAGRRGPSQLTFSDTKQPPPPPSAAFGELVRPPAPAPERAAPGPRRRRRRGRSSTVRRDEPKVGRNDPCPCGSGKKYKKCHGANQ